MAKHRRRRSRSLSGSAAHHKAQVEGHAWDVANYYTDAKHEAEDGLCSSAVRSVQTGGEAEGMTRAHVREGRVNFNFKPIDTARESAIKAIEKNCLVAGKLAGLRRRTSRRK